MAGTQVPNPVSLEASRYASSRRQLNELYNELRSVGIEELIPLPKIAVIGNQSVGKSSLIEAISQIKVPRAAGACTKCPMEVRLYSSAAQEEWSAKVSLSFEDGVPVNKKGEHVFCLTKNRDDVPLI